MTLSACYGRNPAWLLAIAVTGILSLSPLRAHETEKPDAHAMYLANAGVMVSRGDTKVLFDPLFRESFGYYDVVPESIRSAMFAGEAPFDGVDAIFISHYHDDHFSPEDIAAFLSAQSSVHLFAPSQAVDAIAEVSAGSDFASRTHAVELTREDAPAAFELGAIRVHGVYVPHSGWPESLTDVQNIAWRVSLDEHTTVLHLGDADTRPEHFQLQAAFWTGTTINLALPPYWYFLSANGRRVLADLLKPRLSVGVHVPTEVADDPSKRPPELQGYELFTVPGETREIPPH